jgi:hypothetical protein
MKFESLPYLEFKIKEPYDYDNFIKNRKYIQICKQYPHDYTIVHIAIYREYYKDNICYLQFSLYKEIQRYMTIDPHYDSYCLYYEIYSKKNQIQNAMELRALNLILQKIIGDKYFIITWKYHSKK